MHWFMIDALSIQYSVPRKGNTYLADSAMARNLIRLRRKALLGDLQSNFAHEAVHLMIIADCNIGEGE